MVRQHFWFCFGRSFLVVLELCYCMLHDEHCMDMLYVCIWTQGAAVGQLYVLSRQGTCWFVRMSCRGAAVGQLYVLSLLWGSFGFLSLYIFGPPDRHSGGFVCWTTKCYALLLVVVLPNSTPRYQSQCGQWLVMTGDVTAHAVYTSRVCLWSEIVFRSAQTFCAHMFQSQIQPGLSWHTHHEYGHLRGSLW